MAEVSPPEFIPVHNTLLTEGIQGHVVEVPQQDPIEGTGGCHHLLKRSGHASF